MVRRPKIWIESASLFFGAGIVWLVAIAPPGFTQTGNTPYVIRLTALDWPSETVSETARTVAAAPAARAREAGAGDARAAPAESDGAEGETFQSSGQSSGGGRRDRAAAAPALGGGARDSTAVEPAGRPAAENTPRPVPDSGGAGHSVFARQLMTVRENLNHDGLGIELYQDIKAGVAELAPQVPQYGGVVSAGHELGADHLLDLRL